MDLRDKKIFNMNWEIVKEQVYSFVKSYVTAFVTIAYFADSNGIDIFTVSFAIGSAKASALVVIRNLYKLLTEKE